jgi:NADP-dependent 3-hydroxy acid dehydrogenase YdfG
MGRRKLLLEKLKKQYNHKMEIQDIDIDDVHIANQKIDKLVEKL